MQVQPNNPVIVQGDGKVLGAGERWSRAHDENPNHPELSFCWPGGRPEDQGHGQENEGSVDQARVLERGRGEEKLLAHPRRELARLGTQRAAAAPASACNPDFGES